MDGVVLTAGRHKATERAFPSEETTKGSIDTHTDSNQAEHNQRDRHRGRSLMGSMMRMGLHILRTPEDTVVQTEHIEGRHRSNTCHDPTYYRTIGKASRDNLILRTETREERNTSNSQTADQEGDMCNRHILAQATHQGHLIGVNGVDDTTGTQEQTSLEHGVGEEMEHTGHIT